MVSKPEIKIAAIVKRISHEIYTCIVLRCDPPFIKNSGDILVVRSKYRVWIYSPEAFNFEKKEFVMGTQPLVSRDYNIDVKNNECIKAMIDYNLVDSSSDLDGMF